MRERAETTQGGALPLRVRIEESNFDSLADARAGFAQVGDIFRHVPALDTCAIVSGSAFLRNTAKVEGACTPGLSLMTFAPEAEAAADRWLRGENLIQDTATSNDNTPEPTRPDFEPVAELAPAPDNDPSSGPAPDPDPDPWANLSMKKVKAALR